MAVRAVLNQLGEIVWFKDIHGIDNGLILRWELEYNNPGGRPTESHIYLSMTRKESIRYHAIDDHKNSKDHD